MFYPFSMPWGILLDAHRTASTFGKSQRSFMLVSFFSFEQLNSLNFQIILQGLKAFKVSQHRTKPNIMGLRTEISKVG